MEIESLHGQDLDDIWTNKNLDSSSKITAFKEGYIRKHNREVCHRLVSGVPGDLNTSEQKQLINVEYLPMGTSNLLKKNATNLAILGSQPQNYSFLNTDNYFSSILKLKNSFFVAQNFCCCLKEVNVDPWILFEMQAPFSSFKTLAFSYNLQNIFLVCQEFFLD